MKIVDSDAFLDMPLSTQCLYFHLNMRADDDGFVGNPKRVMKVIGASEDDLKLLIVKKFVLTFENGVIVIKHWRMHNTLSKNRYHETQYIDEKLLLRIKQNGSYSLNNRDIINDIGGVEPARIQLNQGLIEDERQIKDEQTANERRTSGEQTANERRTNGEQVANKRRTNGEQTANADLDLDLGLDIDIYKNTTYSCAEPNKSATTQHVISIILNDKSLYPIFQKDIDEWRILYPAVDIIQELRKMKGWCDSNPTKRKTKRGVRRFINGWLSRKQDRGHVNSESTRKNDTTNVQDPYADGLEQRLDE